MKRTLILERAGWIVVGLCVLPLIASATTGSQPEQATPSESSHLDTLLTIHDVRNAIHAPRIQASDCLQSQAERGR